MQIESTEWFKVKAVAALLRVSKATVYRDIVAGRLPAMRFGSGKGSLRVTGSALIEYIAACERAATRPAATAESVIEPAERAAATGMAGA